MRYDACLQTRLGSNRQTISQTRERKKKEPKNRSQKKEKVANRKRQRESKRARQTKCGYVLRVQITLQTRHVWRHLNIYMYVLHILAHKYVYIAYLYRVLCLCTVNLCPSFVPAKWKVFYKVLRQCEGFFRDLKRT